jgi:carbonic anhydrase
MISADKALERLREGNRRYVSDDPSRVLHSESTFRSRLVEGQSPFAVILGCSDSRAPVELLFDQGPGDLFVVRVAGNIAGPDQMGSIEFAVAAFGTPLVVVLGHSYCGAINASLDYLAAPSRILSPNIRGIADHILPSIEPLMQVTPPLEREELVRQSVRRNVSAGVRRLRETSDILARSIRENGLLIVGADYALDTGEVDFFDGLPVC